VAGARLRWRRAAASHVPARRAVRRHARPGALRRGRRDAASQLSTALKSFVAAIEAAKTPSGYPATMTPPLLDNATITYHGMGTTYALAIVRRAPFRLRALFGCLPVHIARDDDVKARNLYVPASTVFFRPQLNFMPASDCTSISVRSNRVARPSGSTPALSAAGERVCDREERPLAAPTSARSHRLR